MRVAHDAPVADHLRRHFDIAPGGQHFVILALIVHRQHSNLSFGSSLCVIIDIDRVHIGAQRVHVQLAHLVGASLVQIDGSVVY